MAYGLPGVHQQLIHNKNLARSILSSKEVPNSRYSSIFSKLVTKRISRKCSAKWSDLARILREINLEVFYFYSTLRDV